MQEPLIGSALELARFSDEGFGRRVLVDGERMRAVLVALEAGQEIPLHSPQLDLVVSVLAGTGRLMAGKQARWVRAGDVAAIPAGTLRGLRAEGGRLIALNVVSPPPGDADHVPEADVAWPPAEPAPDVGGLIRDEHAGLRQQVDELSALAEQLSTLSEAEARARLDGVVRFLREELLPHAEEEERSVYPAVERVLTALGGGTEAMVLDHRRIAALVAELEEAATSSPEEERRPRLRRLLHALEAVLQLHFQKEEEAYLPLLARLSPGERRALYAHLAGEPPAKEA